MQVIPVINCLDFGCVKKRLAQVGEIGSDWAHIDVSDGKFAPVKTWNSPEGFFKLLTTHHQLQTNFEIHLMVEHPEDVFEDWLKVGVKRIIIHVESLRGREGKLNLILEKCSEENVEVMLAIRPETKPEELMPFLDALLFVQVLAVKPGFAGQRFDESAIQKIIFLRELFPDITIEVDGGMNPETAKLAREAGANIVVSASYIFESPNPQAAYELLLNL